MKKLKSSLSKKLKGNAGESLAEVLIALLIAALALTMLASVITTAARTITRSKQQMEAYYAANEWLTAHASSGSGSEDLPTWTMTIKDAAATDDSDDSQVHLVKQSEELKVNYQVNDVVGVTENGTYKGIPVVAFWKAG